MGFIDLEDLSKLPADALPNPPLLLVHLEFFEDSNQGLSLLLTHHLHYISDVLDDSKFYLVAFVLEEDVDHSEEIFLSV